MSTEQYKADWRRIDAMMHSKGVFLEKDLHREYYTGYSYATLYDWDQYFEGIVQLYLGWDTTYLKNGVEIFLDYQTPDGHIRRSSQGEAAQLSEHVKPFLAQIALLCCRRDGNLDFLNDDYYARMKKYLLYWLVDRSASPRGLAVWDSAPHTGMDNQHERAGWWYDCFCEGVDLNCYLVRECTAFSRIAELRGCRADAELFAGHAGRLSTAVQKWLWNEKLGMFLDVDRRSGEQIPVKYIGSFAALWAGVATQRQADRMVCEHLENPAQFKRPFPYPALAADEPGYTEEKLPTDLGCGWRAQTWVPTNYIVFHGLNRYGCAQLAHQLADSTFAHVKSIGDREYYNTESETGNGLNPFWGWSLLAYFMPYEAETGADPTQLCTDRPIPSLK